MTPPKSKFHVRIPADRQPYCHCLFFPFSKGGEMLPVFVSWCFLCLVRRLLSFFFAVLLFLGSLFRIATR